MQLGALEIETSELIKASVVLKGMQVVSKANAHLWFESMVSGMKQWLNLK